MTKIEALKKTIYNLENNVYKYNWNSYEHCNCGILAQTIVGDKDLRACGVGHSPSIKGHGASSEYWCLKTDIPLPLVFQAVKDCGFIYEEMYDLELLQNSEIGLKAKIKYEPDWYKDKVNLIKYLKAWVEILEEENPTYPDITKELAVLPVNETTDTKTVLV